MGANSSPTLAHIKIPFSPAIIRPNISRYTLCHESPLGLEKLTIDQEYEVVTDAYSKALRLNLFGFDGSPLNPMYLAYKPPQMLPTQTLNPTSSATNGAAKSTGKAKRSLEGLDAFTEPLNKNVMMERKEPINADKWWWIGVGMTGLGGVAYYCF